MNEQYTIHFAVLTSETGQIRKILRNDQGMISEDLINLEELVEDRTRLSHFYREVSSHGAAVDRDVNLRDVPGTVQFIGVKTEDHIALICTADKGDLLNRFSELKNNFMGLQRKVIKKNESVMWLIDQINTFFESAGLGFVFLKKDGKIDAFNEMGKDFFHRVTRQSIQPGMSIHELAIPDSENGIRYFLAKSMQGDFFSGDFYAGEWFEVRSTAVKDKEGRQQGVLLIFERINRRKNYEITIENQKEFLYHMYKIFLHDLANIFTVTKSATSLYKRTSNKEMLDSIAEASERGIRMIDRMKKAEKIVHDPDKLWPVSLAEAVYRVMKDYKDLSFICHGQGYIYADDLIGFLLNNLVSNAIRHGKATDMMFEISEDDDSVIFKVANNGEPIPDEIRDKVFDENFEFGETAYSGLGLFIIQKITLRYRGRVRTESCREWNTCFIFTFPKITEPEKVLNQKSVNKKAED